MRPITAGSIHLGDTAPLLDGKVQSHTLGFVHHRASGQYLMAWAEPTAEGPSRILFSSSGSLADGWQEPRPLYDAEGPVEMLELSSGGGTEVPRLFLTWYVLVAPGMRRPMGLLMSDDGGRTWDGPHRIRMDAPYPASGAIPPMDPSGGPGSEHLLHTFVPATTPGQPPMWAVVASDRFVEWSLALRPWQGGQATPQRPGAKAERARSGSHGGSADEGEPSVRNAWGNTLYLGLRHHMPLSAFMAETPQGLALVYLRSPADFAEDAEKPSWPQATVVSLDLPAIMQDQDEDGQPDLEDFLVTQYHEEDLYRLWLQCRIDTREFQRRPFIGGIRKVLNLRKGQILQIPRPYVRASSGVPKSLVLLGRGANKQVQLQDIATNRGSAFMQERGKDRYPDTQGFTLAPGQIGTDDVRPGMVLAQPGWGIVSRRFTAELELPVPTRAMPERALFHFWSHDFPGVILQTSPPDADSPQGTDCRITVQLDEEVALEEGLPFPVLQAEDAKGPDRSPEVIGYDAAPGSRYRLIGIGHIASASPSSGHVTSQGVL